MLVDEQDRALSWLTIDHLREGQHGLPPESQRHLASGPWTNLQARKRSRFAQMCIAKRNMRVTLRITRHRKERKPRMPAETAVTIRMSSGEKAMLEAVADAKGLSNSDVIRQAIRAEYAKLERKRARG
jgi:predicted DNA binding CopG/RHH family protein